jgi:glycine/D-amino acid oxidase-like deaminating enzyme
LPVFVAVMQNHRVMDSARGCLWWEAAGRPASRARLDGDRAADVAVVGGGYTGLWTAYCLLRSDPGLDVVVLEAASVGNGASGRNGGFCSSLLPISLGGLALRHGEGAAVALQRAAIDTLDEIEATLHREQISCDWRRGGVRWIARNPAQMEGLNGMVEKYRRFGFGSDHIGFEAPAVDLNGEGVVGSVFSPHCAAVNPAKLVWGLAAAAERRGAVIHEFTPAIGVRPGRVVTAHGSVEAAAVVLATEGYTAGLPGRRRRILPVYSHMIATEPLEPDLWRAIGWSDHATLLDGEREFIYAQRAPDDRIAVGGRGTTYRWRSNIDERTEVAPGVSRRLAEALVSLWPALREVAVSHEWGGVLGVPRTREPYVSNEQSPGLWSAGGYSGDGVLLSNLLARVLAAAIAGGDDVAGTKAIRRTRPRRWEPEPLRWIGVRLMGRLASHLDHRDREGRPSPFLGRLFDRITGE